MRCQTKQYQTRKIFNRALSDFDKAVKKQLTFAEKTLLQGVLHLNVMVLKR